MCVCVSECPCFAPKLVLSASRKNCPGCVTLLFHAINIFLLSDRFLLVRSSVFLPGLSDQLAACMHEHERVVDVRRQKQYSAPSVIPCDFCVHIVFLVHICEAVGNLRKYALNNIVLESLHLFLDRTPSAWVKQSPNRLHTPDLRGEEYCSTRQTIRRYSAVQESESYDSKFSTV